jgi:hypothetical protein
MENDVKSNIVALILALVSAALIAASGASDAGSEERWMPLSVNAQWTYEVSGAASPRARVMVKSGPRAGLWTLDWDGRAVEARLDETGVRLLETRHVGVAGKATKVPMAELRWSGEGTWKTRTASGCMVYDLLCTRAGHETVRLPAGTFDCLKITVDNLGQPETWWLAPGVGIVKHVQKQGRETITWALVRYAPGR